MRCERGQATVDYVALVAIVAVLVAGATAVAGGGAPSIVNAVLGQVRQALCIVSGSACPAAKELPCVTASDRDNIHVAIKVVILRVDRDHVVVREQLSNGSVRLTLLYRAGNGIELGVGGMAQATYGGRVFGARRDARGGAQGVFAIGRVYVADNEREAGAILRGLLRPRLPGTGPAAREIFIEGGVRALGRLGLDGKLLGASLDAMAESVVGARRDQRSGEITISLGTGSSGLALLNMIAVGPAGSTDRNAGIDVRLDRRGRPVGLTLRGSGTLGAGGSLAPTGAGSQWAGQVGSFATGSRRWELEARIDLRDTAVVAAWAAFRRAPADPAAIAALGAQLRDRAYIDVRGYGLRSSSSGGAGEVALGAKLGGELYVTRDRAQLLAAVSRPPGGLWEQRIDCLLA